ncbi:hypothetical protein QCA50_020013 [Cerrena zonata]|uniref:F-box protein n=1 Tax=Cerrena zonata TaxID=2478898 RepID=A0AAW0FE09_9APHY
MTRMTPGTDAIASEIVLLPCCEGSIPDMLSLGVYDYDDARGILILGDAFGELAVVDFSGSDPHMISQCLAKPIEIIPHADEKHLPMDAIPSHPGPPFPYLADDVNKNRSIINGRPAPKALGYWHSQRPDVCGAIHNLPQGEGWSVDEFKFRGDLTGIALLNPKLWQLDNASHFYGRPIPLLFRTMHWGDYCVIFDVGGLLLTWSLDLDEYLWCIHPNTTLEQLVDSITDCQDEALDRRPARMNGAQEYSLSNFLLRAEEKRMSTQRLANKTRLRCSKSV